MDDHDLLVLLKHVETYRGWRIPHGKEIPALIGDITLWLLNTAVENAPFLCLIFDDLPVKTRDGFPMMALWSSNMATEHS